jgi:integrase/recombinase XerD
VAIIRWSRHPSVAANDWTRRWLQIQADIGLAQNTVDAYGRGLEEFLGFLRSVGAPFLQVTREHVAGYVRFLQAKPGQVDHKVVAIDSTSRLSNATLQQRITVVRLFYDFLHEEQQTDWNPVGRGRYRPGTAFGVGTQRGLIPRIRKLPWIPDELAWNRLVDIVAQKSIRTRLMFALCYDAALRREELCLLKTSDFDPGRQLIRVRAETTKNRLERVVPYTPTTRVLFGAYLEHRRNLSRDRGPLFLSASPRNRSQPISIWTWSKTVEELARESSIPELRTHTLRHLRLTDLARAGWDIHEIATYAGHRSIQTTLRYVHLSGRELAQKIAKLADLEQVRLKGLTEKDR